MTPLEMNDGTQTHFDDIQLVALHARERIAADVAPNSHRPWRQYLYPTAIIECEFRSDIGDAFSPDHKSSKTRCDVRLHDRCGNGDQRIGIDNESLGIAINEIRRICNGLFMTPDFSTADANSEITRLERILEN